MGARAKAPKITLNPRGAAEPSRLAATSFRLGLMAAAAVVLGAVVAWMETNSTREILACGGIVAFGLGLAGIISGLLTRLKIRKIAGALDRLGVPKSAMRVKAEKRSLAGIITGFFGVASPLIVLALVSSGFSRKVQHYSANESSLIESLRTINRANASYYEKCGHSFAAKLSDLGPPEAGKPDDCHAAGLIEASLAWGAKQGYKITYIASRENTQGKIEAYAVRAEPVIRSLSGKRSFYTDESGVIRSRAKGIATVEDEPVE